MTVAKERPRREQQNQVNTTNVLCLGMSYADIEAQVLDLGIDPNILICKTRGTTQIVECIQRNILTEMDGRDLARVVAMERLYYLNVYTVSLENAAMYHPRRHLCANFGRPNFCTQLVKKFGTNVKFSQVFLDYFWIPKGTWMAHHWTRSFFRITLVKMANLIQVQTNNNNNNKSLKTGAIYLPFCAHCLTQIVAAHELFSVYNISFVYKDQLQEHALWSATQSIPPTIMQQWMGKDRAQEELYCQFSTRDVSESMEDTRVSRSRIVALARRIPDLDNVRMFRMEPIPPQQANNNNNKRREGGFVGLLPPLHTTSILQTTQPWIQEQQQTKRVRPRLVSPPSSDEDDNNDNDDENEKQQDDEKQSSNKNQTISLSTIKKKLKKKKRTLSEQDEEKEKRPPQLYSVVYDLDCYQQLEDNEALSKLFRIHDKEKSLLWPNPHRTYQHIKSNSYPQHLLLEHKHADDDSSDNDYDGDDDDDSDSDSDSDGDSDSDDSDDSTLPKPEESLPPTTRTTTAWGNAMGNQETQNHHHPLEAKKEPAPRPPPTLWEYLQHYHPREKNNQQPTTTRGENPHHYRPVDNNTVKSEPTTILPLPSPTSRGNIWGKQEDGLRDNSRYLGSHENKQLLALPITSIKTTTTTTTTWDRYHHYNKNNAAIQPTTSSTWEITRGNQTFRFSTTDKNNNNTASCLGNGPPKSKSFSSFFQNRLEMLLIVTASDMAKNNCHCQKPLPHVSSCSKPEGMTKINHANHKHHVHNNVPSSKENDIATATNPTSTTILSKEPVSFHQHQQSSRRRRLSQTLFQLLHGQPSQKKQFYQCLHPRSNAQMTRIVNKVVKRLIRQEMSFVWDDGKTLSPIRLQRPRIMPRRRRQQDDHIKLMDDETME